MVLNRSLVYLLIVSCMAGCSTIFTHQEPSGPPVIPAYSDPDENQDNQTNNKIQQEQTSPQKNLQQRLSVESQSQPQTTTQSMIPNKTSGPSSPVIVQNLIGRAEKAVKLQQWLRAQHILEQALHIAPNNAKVFLIYGDVYLNLGILAQAEQMYRRSVALANEQSSIENQARQKLKALQIGN